MQSSDVQGPPEWPSGGWRSRAYLIRLVCTYVLAGIVSAVCVLLAVQAVQEGDTTPLKYLFGIIVFLGLALGFNSIYRPKSNGNLAIHDRVVDGETAPTVYYSKTPPTMLCVVMGFMGLLLIFAAYDLRPQPDPEAILPQPESGGYGGVVFFALLALFFWSLPISFAIRRLSTGYISFTSLGIYQRGWAIESFLPWSNIAGATAAYREYPMTLIISYPRDGWKRRYKAWFWKIDRLPPVALIEIDYRKMSDDAVLLHNYVVDMVRSKTGR